MVFRQYFLAQAKLWVGLVSVHDVWIRDKDRFWSLISNSWVASSFLAIKCFSFEFHLGILVLSIVVLKSPRWWTFFLSFLIGHRQRTSMAFWIHWSYRLYICKFTSLFWFPLLMITFASHILGIWNFRFDFVFWHTWWIIDLWIHQFFWNFQIWIFNNIRNYGIHRSHLLHRIDLYRTKRVSFEILLVLNCYLTIVLFVLKRVLLLNLLFLQSH